jgi:hypothetical protein
MPDIVQKHRHVKTKYIHVYHPKVLHSDHSTYVHSRHDPNVGLVNGGYPQPLVNLNKHKPELRITEEEFLKWRQEQVQKALEKRQKHQEDQQLQSDAEDDDGDVFNTQTDLNEGEDEKYTDQLYKKHKANKENSSNYRKESSKHKNHNYNQDFQASNSDKTVAKVPARSPSKRKPSKASQAVRQTSDRPRKNPPKSYGLVNQQFAEPSNIQPQIYNEDQTMFDPTYYSTLPKDQTADGTDQQDDIYSGLLSSRFNQRTADKSKILAEINYNRKQQTKIYNSQNRRTQ